MKLSQWNEGIAIPLELCSKCHKIIDHIWHYLICYKLNFNLNRNNIQFNGINKIYNVNNLFFGISLILIKNKVHKKNCTIHDHGYIYNLNLIYNLNQNLSYFK
jgi:hypothetical protein